MLIRYARYSVFCVRLGQLHTALTALTARRLIQGDVHGKYSVSDCPTDFGR